MCFVSSLSAELPTLRHSTIELETKRIATEKPPVPQIPPPPVIALPHGAASYATLLYVS